ncbi:MAG: DUF2231 domain-containing protein [Acidimicrobiales bacterium]|nr:DUF2231 domain-containing protein [Acidimicrobiales bacterium]
MVRAGRWCLAPQQRWFVVAVAVAFLLRLAWVLWLGAAEPIEAHSDTGRNLAMARQFADFQTYRLYGRVTAYNPPGYSLLLTPAAMVSRATGWFALPIAAAFTNVVAGTATVVLGGVLAHRWFGRRARTATAWVLAVAAGPVYLTAVALTETVFTALVLAVLLIVSGWLVGRPGVSRRALLGVGALIGFTALVRPPGLLLVLVAAGALIAVRGSWRTAWRPALAVSGVALLVLVPWTVRNIVQVGTFTPVATNGAAFLCQGHGPGVKADVDDMTEEDFVRCFTGSPFDPRDIDEAAWASERQRDAINWALTHPLEEIELTWDKTYATMVNDHQALADARDGDRRDVASPRTLERLDRLGEWWHRFVLVTGLLGLALVPRARKAWPLWATAAGLVAVVWLGNALDRYHHTTMALLAVFAGALLTAGLLGRAGRWAMMTGQRGVERTKEHRIVRQEERQRGPAGPEEAPAAAVVPEVDAPVALTAAEGLAQAAQPGGPWAGRYGRPLHPLVASVAIGAWVCALGFDLISQLADTAWVYARGAYVLTGAGVAVGVVAATIGLADLVRVPRDTPAFRTGVRHLLAMDTCLVLFAVSFLIRRGSDFEWHDPVAPLPLVVSLIGLSVLAFGVWLGTRLAYGYGVRVSLEADRLAGFELETDPRAADAEDGASAGTTVGESAGDPVDA